jgi:putative transposase
MDSENNIIKLPNIGKIKAVLHKIFEEKLKIAMILMSRTGKYYINIFVEDYDK